ncbi:MAG: glycosyltransferase family A protein [Clostridia bacterium]
MNKVLSVAIAAYQAEATLRETLESLAHVNALALLDVIIVDDGSRDKTAEIAQEYVSRYPEAFRLCSKENGGWGSTVNKGIELAQGKYLLQLDSDDYVENMDALLAYLSRCDTDLVYAPHRTFRDRTGETCKLWTDPQHHPAATPLPLEQVNCVGSVHNLIIKTDILKTNHVTISEHCFYTDVGLVCKSYRYARTISYFDQTVYAYRLSFSGQSMSKAGIRKHYRDHVLETERLLDFRSEEQLDEHMDMLLVKRLRDMAYYCYLFFYALPATAEQKRELIAYDDMLKAKAPDIYQQTQGPVLNLLRAVRFNGYWAAAHVKSAVDKLRRKNIYEAD